MRDVESNFKGKNERILGAVIVVFYWEQGTLQGKMFRVDKTRVLKVIL